MGTLRYLGHRPEAAFLPQPRKRRPLDSDWVFGSLTALGVLIFMMPWYRSFLAPNLDGWFLFLAEQLGSGKFPYRDYFLVVPPLHLLEVAALSWLFGDRLIWLRIVGMLLRVALGVFLYRWLSANYERGVSALAAVTTVALYSSDIADVVMFYNHNAALWATCAGFAASTLIRRLSRREPVTSTAFAVGMLVSLTALEKQTLGLCVGAAIIAIVLLSAKQHRSATSGLRLVGAVGTGAFVPLLAVGSWLAWNGAFTHAVSQTLLGGTTSKGPLMSVLWRPFVAPTRDAYFLVPALAAALLLLAYMGLQWLRKSRRASALEELADFAPALAAVAAVGLGLVGWSRTPRLVAVYLALFGSIWMIAALARKVVRREANEGELQRLLLAACGFAFAYGFGVSWPLWETMALPGLALLLCEAAGRNGRRWRLERTAALLFAGFLLVTTTSAKMARPYSWAEWADPPVWATAPISAPSELAGLRLAPSVVDFAGRVTSLLAGGSEPGEPIFVFPNYPLFYLLADRRPATLAWNHWFDVAPDQVAERDAEILLEAPPAAFAVYEVDPVEWRNNEIWFRNGAESGQRALRLALQKLEASGHYRLVAELRAPGTGNRVRVWNVDRSNPPLGLSTRKSP